VSPENPLLRDHPCEGGCSTNGECRGDVAHVHVYTKDKDWGLWYYCETAQMSDRSHGFVVEKVED
jgi:hypothetical protein